MAVVQSMQIRCFFGAQNPINRTQDKQPHHLQIHQHPTKRYHLKDSGKSGEFTDAHQVFDQIPQTNTFAWNSLIRHYLSNGNPEQALSVYSQMLVRGVRPDKYTVPAVLLASRLLGSLSNGKQIHAHAVKLRFGSDKYVITALMAMYGHFDGAEAARRLFDKSSLRNSVSWTLMAGLYAIEDKPDLALEMFNQMVTSGIPIDSVSLATVLRVCACLKSLREGRKVHEIARKNGLECDIIVGNSLLKMYLDCGSVEDARTVFEQMPLKDHISWTAIISVYVQNGGFNEGLKLFRAMHLEGTKSDSFSISSVLPACARTSAHKHGKEIHGHVIRNNIELNLAVQNALMDMYVKSGCMESASKIFTRMTEKDAISWTVMILGYSLHGQGEVGVELFHEMDKHTSIQPDRITYNAVLHACNTARMVEEGRFYFNCISEPKIGEYTLMVSLLARAGLFDKARAFVEEHQIGQHAEVQRALLNGCRVHRNIMMGKRIAEQLTEVEPLNAENYVLLSNFYAANAKWDMVSRLREMIRDMGLEPKRAYSWIEIRNKVHVFGVGDVSHPRSERIYWKLQDFMKMAEGCVLDEDFSLHDVDEERECIPCGHSEMLAITLGLISTHAKAMVRITKNLRVCRNCHASAKILSKMVKREIVLKDPNQFHHFKDGCCSCGDFW